MDMLRSLQVLPMTLDVLQVSPVHDYNISKLISVGGGGGVVSQGRISQGPPSGYHAARFLRNLTSVSLSIS